MTKEEYIEEIIHLSSQLCQKPDDYTKEKVKVHNKAARKLTALENTLDNDLEMAGEVYAELLDNEDTYIKQRSAAACLHLNLHIKKSVKILEYLRKHGERWETMGAERQLKIWRGEIGPNDPG